MKLADKLVGRDNNLNLLRIVAATMVLITHSFALAIGTGDAEPFRTTLGMTLGHIAVDVFFVASGLLVTASLFKSSDLLDYFCARALRILPALIVMLILVVFVVGPVMTTVPVGDYLRSKKTWMYLAKCSTLLFGVNYELPGVFETNPYRGAVNGSLWTMPFEVQMYCLLAAIWLVVSVLGRSRRPFATVTLVLLIAIASGAVVLAQAAMGIDDKMHIRLIYMFFTGASYYVLRDRIPLSGLWCIVLIVAMALAVWMDRRAFVLVYYLSIAYVTFCIAYLPAGWIRKYNALGDYSYGMYIFAFPIQQILAAKIPGIDPPHMIVYSMAMTLTLAILSWHFLEKPALGLRKRCVERMRRWLPAWGRT